MLVSADDEATGRSRLPDGISARTGGTGGDEFIGEVKRIPAIDRTKGILKLSVGAVQAVLRERSW